MGDLKSFEELDAVFNKEKNEAESAKQLERIKTQFHRIRRGHFESNLKEVDSFIFTPVGNNEERSVNVTVIYKGKGGSKKRFPLALLEDGGLSGPIPADCTESKENLKMEIFRILDTVNLEFWHGTDVDILPESDKKEETEEKGEVNKKEEAGVRPERLEFMAKQRGALFGFIGKEGFDGYQASVFQHPTEKKAFIILENEKYGNAAFVVDIKHIPVPPEKLNPSEPPVFSDKEVSEIAHSIWDPIAEKARTRKELQEHFRAKRVLHSGDWEKRMQEEINTRLGS